jgi:hypothetical protein
MKDFTEHHVLYRLVKDHEINKLIESIYDDDIIDQLRTHDYEIEFALIEAIKNKDFNSTDTLCRRFSKYVNCNHRIAFMVSKSTLEIFKLFNFQDLVPFYRKNNHMHPMTIASSNNNIPILEYIIQSAIDERVNDKVFSLMYLN